MRCGHAQSSLLADRLVVSLWLTGQCLSMPASVGFIELFDLAVGNGIVLVSHN